MMIPEIGHFALILALLLAAAQAFFGIAGAGAGTRPLARRGRPGGGRRSSSC